MKLEVQKCLGSSCLVVGLVLLSGMQCRVQLTQLQILRNMSSLQLSEASGESLEAKGELCLRLLLQPGQIPMSRLEVPPHETCLHEADCCSYSERSLCAEGPLGGDALP